MLFCLLLSLILPAAYAIADGSACGQVTSSECETAPNTPFQLPSKADCLALCDIYAGNGLGCIFAAWAESANSNCRLYTLPFWQFIRSCKVLGGPPKLTGCNVENPEDNTCNAVRDGNCFYYGDTLESVDNIDSWEMCEAFCSTSPDCKAWTFRDEPSLECRLLASDDRTCQISYVPSGVDPEDCGPVETGLLVIGGMGRQSDTDFSVELWTPETSCSLPSLPISMEQGPSVDIVQGLPVACYKDACYQLNGASWVHYQDTIYTRSLHTSAVLEDRLLIVGGEAEDTSSTTEFLNGKEAKKGFPLSHGRSNHCSVQVNPTTIVLIGGDVDSSSVTEYAHLTGEVTTRNLPDLITGRWSHACSFYMVGQSQVLIVVGGSGSGSGDTWLHNTELLDYSDPVGGWREVHTGVGWYDLRAAKLRDVIYVVGGFGARGPVDTVFYWSPEDESWKQTKSLSQDRAIVGVTEVSLAVMEEYCSVLH